MMEVDDDDAVIFKNSTKKNDFLSDAEDDSIENDTVVWERDVVVCNSTSNTEMYSLSYPSGKKDAWDNQRLPMARFKKNVRLLEMRLIPDVHTGSYDKKKAEMLYEGEGTSSTPQKIIDVNSLRKNDEVYEGRAFVNDHPIINSIGFLQNGQFYIHPLAGSFEMHRSINSLNRKKKGGKMDDDDAGSTEDEDDQPNTSSGNVRVKFSRPETERQKKRREASALHREKKIASDVWLPMKVYLRDDKESKQKISEMSRTGIKTENQFEVKSMDIRELVNKAIICGIKEDLVIESGKEHMLSKQRIDELAADLQIKAHMVKAHVIRTSEMIKFVEPTGIGKSDVINTLQQCARLVNGVWVLQSDLLFHNLPPAHSNVAGKTDLYRAELWRNARDLALCLIDAGLKVTRRTLMTCFQLNEKDSEEILSTFGVRDLVERRWTLRIDKDYEFLNDPLMQSCIIEEKKKWMERFEDLQKLISKNSECAQK